MPLSLNLNSSDSKKNKKLFLIFDLRLTSKKVKIYPDHLTIISKL